MIFLQPYVFSGTSSSVFHFTKFRFQKDHRDSRTEEREYLREHYGCHFLLKSKYYNIMQTNILYDAIPCDGSTLTTINSIQIIQKKIGIQFTNKVHNFFDQNRSGCH